jgi:hypothetical protein
VADHNSLLDGKSLSLQKKYSFFTDSSLLDQQPYKQHCHIHRLSNYTERVSVIVLKTLILDKVYI